MAKSKLTPFGNMGMAPMAAPAVPAAKRAKKPKAPAVKKAVGAYARGGGIEVKGKTKGKIC